MAAATLGWLVEQFLKLSGKARPAYPASLGGRTDPDALERVFRRLRVPAVPLLEEVYGRVSGTPRDVADQRLMDFKPGYRLLQIDELADAARFVNEIAKQPDEHFVPLLANYSSDYVCIDVGRRSGAIMLVLHDAPEPVITNNSADAFLQTLCAFYRESVYFVDADGYLDYDPVAEGEVGSSLNPGVAYWGE